MALEIRPSDSLNVPSFATRSGSATVAVLAIETAARFAAQRHHFTTAGSSTAFTGIISGLIEVAIGTKISMLMDETCGNNPTLNINGDGAIELLRGVGEDILAGDLVHNRVYDFIARGSPLKWYFENSFHDDIDSLVAAQRYHFTTAGTPTAYTGIISGLIEVAIGTKISILMDATCGNNPTLNINSDGAIELLRGVGENILAGDLVHNRVYDFIARGSPLKWYFENPVFEQIDTEVVERLAGQRHTFFSGGTATALTGSISDLEEIVAGTKVNVYMHVDCGASPTLNINGDGALSILRAEGAPLRARDMVVGATYNLTARGDPLAWHFDNPVFDYIDTGRRHAITAGGSSTVITATASDLVEVVTGTKISILMDATCGANPTLNINGDGAINLLRYGGENIHSGDLLQNHVYDFIARGSPLKWYFENSFHDDIEFAQRHHFTTAGTSTAFTGLVSDLFEVAIGTKISMLMDATCGASPTLNINGFGAINLIRGVGENILAGDLVHNRVYDFIARGSPLKWYFENPVFEQIETEVAERLAGQRHTFFSGGTAAVLTGSIPNLEEIVAGTKVNIYMHVDCAAAPMLNINGYGSLSILRAGGDPILARDMIEGATYNLTARGDPVAWYFDNPVFDYIDTGRRHAITAGGSSTALTGVADDLYEIKVGTRVSIFMIVNCGDSPTLALNGGSAIALLKRTGASILAGDLRDAGVYNFIARGSPMKWYFENPVFEQLEEVAADVAELSAGQRHTFTASGTAIALTGTIASLDEIVVGSEISIFMTVNCGDSPTLALNGGSAIALLRSTGVPIQEDDLKGNSVYDFAARGSPVKWYFENPVFGQIDEIAADVAELSEGQRHTFTAGGTTTALTGTIAGLSEVVVGSEINVFMTFDCGDSPTLALNGDSAIALLRSTGEPIQEDDLKNGSVYDFIARGSPVKWYFENPVFEQLDDAAGRIIVLETSVDDILDGAASSLIVSVRERPGDAVKLFTQTMVGGEPSTNPPLSDDLAVTGARGKATILAGSGSRVQRTLFAVEDGIIYEARALLARTVNSDDESNDSIRVAAAWYNASKVRLTGPSALTVVQSFLNLLVADGPQAVSRTLSKTAGTGVDLTIPAGAYYGRLFVQQFGATATSLIDVLSWDRAGDAVLFNGRLHDATGTLAQRDQYDDEVPPFVFLRLDGAEWEYYARVGASGGWSDPFTPRGETGAGVPAGGSDGEFIFRSGVGTAWGLPEIEQVTGLVDALQTRAHQVATRAALLAMTVPVIMLGVQIDKYESGSEWQPGWYKRVASEPTHAMKAQDADLNWYELDQSDGNILHFGGKLDGATDNHAAMDRARAYFTARGGGKLRLLPATMRWVLPSAYSGWNTPDNMVLEGFGDTSVIQIENTGGSFFHVFNTNAIDVRFSNFKIVGDFTAGVIGIIFPLGGADSHNLLFDRVSLDLQNSKTSATTSFNAVQAYWVNGDIDGATWQGGIIERARFGWGCPNESDAVVKNLMFWNVTFKNCLQGMLTLNSPLMPFQSVEVSSCWFVRDEDYFLDDGYALGCSVTGVVGAYIVGNWFDGWFRDALHSEENSGRIVIEANQGAITGLDNNDGNGIFILDNNIGGAAATPTSYSVTNNKFQSLDGFGKGVWVFLGVTSEIGAERLVLIGNDMDGFDIGYNLGDLSRSKAAVTTGNIANDCTIGVKCENPLPGFEGNSLKDCATALYSTRRGLWGKNRYTNCAEIADSDDGADHIGLLGWRATFYPVTITAGIAAYDLFPLGARMHGDLVVSMQATTLLVCHMREEISYSGSRVVPTSLLLDSTGSIVKSGDGIVDNSGQLAVSLNNTSIERTDATIEVDFDGLHILGTPSTLLAPYVKRRDADLSLVEEEFWGDSLDARWTPLTAGSGAIAMSNDLGQDGQARLTTGAVAGLGNAAAIVTFRTWKPSNGRIIHRWRYNPVAITGVNYAIGMGNQTTLVVPVTIAAGDVATADVGSTAFAGIVFDTDAATDRIWLVGVNGSTVTIEDAGVAPVIGVNQSWQMEIETDGKITWYRGTTFANAVKIGSQTVAGAVLASAFLGPLAAIQSREAVAKTLSLQYMFWQGARV